MTSLSRPARALVASIAATAMLGAAACSGDDGTDKKRSESTTSSTSGVPPKPGPPAVNPLRGGGPSAHGVVGVKIDDTGSGRPQGNIDKADIVYIEEVEGGLTRLLAVFNSTLPSVAAVRSTRAADPELLAQYGPIAYVASGGAKNPMKVLRRSSLRTSINDRGGPGFRRDGGRPAPYNLIANLQTVAKALKSPRAKSVGFSWSYATTGLKGTARGVQVQTVVGATAVEFRYNARTKRYYRYIGGSLQRTAAGAPVSTPNVIVQFCKVEPYYADRDVNGNPNAYTHTVGKGKLVVFRNGRRVPGTWSRAKAASGTTIRNARGKPIPLRPGGAWVVLTKTGKPLR